MNWKSSLIFISHIIVIITQLLLTWYFLEENLFDVPNGDCELMSVPTVGFFTVHLLCILCTCLGHDSDLSLTARCLFRMVLKLGIITICSIVFVLHAIPRVKKEEECGSLTALLIAAPILTGSLLYLTTYFKNETQKELEENALVMLSQNISSIPVLLVLQTQTEWNPYFLIFPLWLLSDTLFLLLHCICNVDLETLFFTQVIKKFYCILKNSLSRPQPISIPCC